MDKSGETQAAMPDIRVPAGWTLAGLAAGIALGLVLSGNWAGTGALDFAVAICEPLGALWLRALQMTIVPLVAGLLVIGIVQAVKAANAGTMARATLGRFIVILSTSAVTGALVMPLLIDLFPIPARAAAALRDGLASADPGPVPSIGDFVAGIVPVNILAAASTNSMLPLIVFFALFALALTRLAETQRERMTELFTALTGAMLVIVGWVLALAPLGVFALGLVVAAKSGTAAIGVLAHYIVLVSSVGTVVLIAAYALAAIAARQPLLRFARAVAPAQAVAISTQSSLASLPAMLAACRSLGLRDASGEFVLPLAVAMFRATGPAMNMAVAIYVAKLTGVAVTPATLAAGVMVACILTYGTVSLPNAITFIATVGPIALAMGVPIGPLALLVAVEVLPDIMRTLGNVTMDVAVTATVDRKTSDQSALP